MEWTNHIVGLEGSIIFHDHRSWNEKVLERRMKEFSVRDWRIKSQVETRGIAC